MNTRDSAAFQKLFREAYLICFGHSIEGNLTEPESRLFANEIFDKTGLIIGWKSLKNYSSFILDSPAIKTENPSLSTLDTLARYVSGAPLTDEKLRKNTEDHFPYWYQYVGKELKSGKVEVSSKSTMAIIISVIFLVVIISFSLIYWPRRSNDYLIFSDQFNSVNADSLIDGGWLVKSRNDKYWNHLGDRKGFLTLYTLQGDNWADSSHSAVIQNLLIRKINTDCFTAEVQFSDFIPMGNWQQAGILLLEDTSFAGKSIRFSLGYNDYSGGAPVSREILIQAIVSLGINSMKPEEVVHQPVFHPGQDSEKLISENLSHSSLRIEKKGDLFRLLFSDGAFENSAFREVGSRSIDIKPHYIGIFALRGFGDTAENIPVLVNYFSISGQPCK